MDPLTASLFVAASFASNIYSSRNQARVEEASINAQLAQSRLQSAEASYERTKQFRQTMSSNLALSGLGIGGTSGLRNVNAQNISDYFADVAAIGNQDMFSTLQATTSRATSQSNRFVRELGAVSDAATLASQLGLFSKKKATK